MCKLIGCSHIEAAQEQHLSVLSACYSVQRLARLFAVRGSGCCCWVGLERFGIEIFLDIQHISATKLLGLVQAKGNLDIIEGGGKSH